ncbi:MAG: InlB B-repeat-containing protein, partial [Candidatus Izemoplasmataceae bacterium]
VTQDETEEATISFNSNGGTNHPAITQEVGTTLPNLPTPVKEGYTFQGWYTSNSLTNAFTSTTMPESNKTLYAKWEAMTTSLDLVLQVLVDDYDFECDDTNCILSIASTTAYFFHINTLEFSFRTTTNEGGSTTYRQLEEVLIIDKNYAVRYLYELEEDYGIYYYTNFTLTGNAITENYRVTLYNSNYQDKDTLEAKAMQRISQLMPLIDAILSDAGVTFDDLQ